MSETVQRVLITVGAAGILIAIKFSRALLSDNKRRLGRRVYWTGWALGVPLFLIGMQATMMKTRIALPFWALLAFWAGVCRNPYLTINGRNYALLRQHRQPDPDPRAP
jgi:hypothetical protein